MVLALDYMQKTKTVRPDVEKHFLEKIDVGYRRLLGFEVKSEPGGFDWWGKPPANLFLSAYGLMEFRDMAEVYPVDPDAHPSHRGVPALEAVRRRLLAAPAGQAGWSTDMAKGQAFNLTAYVAWGLARAGEPSEKALRWLAARTDQVRDPYGLALAALAFLTADPDAGVGQRAGRASGRLGEPGRERASRGSPRGRPASARADTRRAIETTALAIQALLLDGRHRPLAYDALDRLIQWRGKDGRFGTTQSTILALKALLAADAGASKRGDMTVRIERGEASETFELPADSTERRRATFAGPGPASLAVSAVGPGRVRATVSRTSWVPWTPLPEAKSRLAFSVRYPDEALQAGRRAEATVRVLNVTDDKPASVVTLEVGIPPGCTVSPRDVTGKAARIELGERHVVIYLRDLAPREERTFRVRFTPRYALDVVTAPSLAYEYYVPEEAVLVPPQPVRAVR